MSPDTISRFVSEIQREHPGMLYTEDGGRILLKLGVWSFRAGASLR